MDLMTILMNRYSTRRFSDKEVPEDVTAKLLESARLAPTAHNFQAFHIYLLKGTGANTIMDQITRCNYHAPLNLLITLKRSESWKRSDGYDLADLDIGIVGTHIMLMAEELGLGCCWIGVLDTSVAKTVLNLPEDEELVTAFEIGYKVENDNPGPLHAKRKTIDELVTEIIC